MLPFSVYLEGSGVPACLLTHCFQLLASVSPSGQIPPVMFAFCVFKEDIGDF